MKQVFKRLLSLSLAVLLVAVLLPAELVTHAYASDYVQLTGLADQAQTVSSPAIQPQADASTSTPATFRVGGQTYTDLGDAIAAAQSGADKTIVVATDGALTGSYTIPAGVTLLVPFDAAATLYKETPKAIRTAPDSKVYRKLVLAADAALTVEGAISVGGQYYSPGGSQQGRMVGDYGYLWLNTGAAITVKNGGALYAWGFVSGNGTVAAESGAKVYEWFQVGDFRGGSATMSIAGCTHSDKRVFPLSQYYIQNIEAALTVYAGAEEILHTDIYANENQNAANVNFIGSSGMFNVVSGSLTKQYDPAKDRMVYTVNGQAELNSLKLNLGMTVDSSSFVLPITNNMTLHITPRSSITTKQDIALLPGVQVYVDKAAELTIAAGKKAYIYDSDQWTDQNYVNPNAKFKSVGYSPTKRYTRTNADLVDALVDVNGTLIAAGAIYTTKSGADVCSSQKTGRYIMKATSGTETITYQFTQSGSSVTPHNIDIDPIRLKNDDGSYTATTGKAQDQYNFEVDKWLKCQRLLVIFDPNYTGAPEIEVQKVAPSTATPLLSNPFTREGYDFTGWTTAADGSGTSYADKANITLTADTTLYAQWELQKFTVTWKNEDGTVLETSEVEYGTVPKYTGETPTKEGDAQYTYTFAGWDSEVAAVTEDVTYTATFDQTVNTYTVTWVDENGTELEKDENVPYGETPAYNGEQPTKAGDAQYTYTFTGWEPTVSAVTENATYTATFTNTTRTYTVTWKNWDGTELEKDENVPYGTMPSFDGTEPTKAADAQYRYTFKGWDSAIAEVTGDVTYTAQYSATERVFYTITFNANGGEGNMEAQRFEVGFDTTLNANTFTRENYKFIGWNTAADGSGATYVDKATNPELTGDMTLYAQWQFQTGWVTDETGRQYYKDGELQKTGWTEIDGETYYLNIETGYAATGITTLVPDGATEEARCVFDDMGVFQKDVTGVYTVGTDTYWLNSGIIEEEAGLKRVVKEDGEVNYYYFGADSKAYKATAEKREYVVEKNNGYLLPEGNNYRFDENGVIEHFDGCPNGIYHDETTDNYYYCVDGVIIANGLMLIDDNYYYAKTSTGAFVRNQSYWISKTNGLLDEGIYAFDSEGRIVFPEEPEKKSGFVEENGGLYYYKDGVLTGAGLIKVDDDYYYVKTSTGEVVRDRTYWITATNDLLPMGQYTFDTDGKLINPPTSNPDEPDVKDGIVAERGSFYYYKDGVLTGAGLIQIDGNYYYVKTSNGEVVHGRSYWITATNDLLSSGLYNFADDGKLIQ